MRNINVEIIEDKVRELCIKANRVLPQSLEQRIHECKNIEQSPSGKSVFDDHKTIWGIVKYKLIK